MGTCTCSGSSQAKQLPSSRRPLPRSHLTQQRQTRSWLQRWSPKVSTTLLKVVTHCSAAASSDHHWAAHLVCEQELWSQHQTGQCCACLHKASLLRACRLYTSGWLVLVLFVASAASLALSAACCCLLLAGADHMVQGSVQEAQLSYERALQACPEHAPALYNLGVLHHQQGQVSRCCLPQVCQLCLCIGAGFRAGCAGHLRVGDKLLATHSMSLPTFHSGCPARSVVEFSSHAAPS